MQFLYECFDLLLILYFVLLLDFYVMLIFLLEVPLLSNSTYYITFSFSFVSNLFFRLFTSKFKFPIFKLTIAMVWNNLVTLSACITSSTTSSIDFGVLVYVVGFLNPSTKDPSSCTNIFPSPNSNGSPSTDPSLLIGTCNSSGLNIATRIYVPTLSIYNPIACKPPYVNFCCCCCSYCKWCCKYWKCCGFSWLSIQSS